LIFLKSKKPHPGSNPGVFVLKAERISSPPSSLLHSAGERAGAANTVMALSLPRQIEFAFRRRFRILEQD